MFVRKHPHMQHSIRNSHPHTPWTCTPLSSRLHTHTVQAQHKKPGSACLIAHIATLTHSYVGKHTLVCSCTHREMLSSLRDSQRAAKKDRLLWEPGGICHSELNRHIYYVQEIKEQKTTICCFILMRDHSPLIGTPTLIWRFFFHFFWYFILELIISVSNTNPRLFARLWQSSDGFGHDWLILWHL